MLENTGSCSFLQVGACKSGGWNLFLVGARKSELSLPSGWCLLPIGIEEFWKLVLPINVIF
jgi:hypothetical protein